jgi:predicted nucleic acid-binding protein
LPIVFLDSSALVKLVALEAETDALRAYLREGEREIVTSELAVTEVRRAGRRIGHDPSSVLAQCDVVLLRSELLSHAAELDPVTLRTLDAIQLATALSLGSRLDAFVAYDERLLAAAAQHGLSTAAPA